MDTFETVGAICVLGFAMFWILGIIIMLVNVVFKNRPVNKWDCIVFLDKSKFVDKKQKVKVSTVIIICLFLFLSSDNTFLQMIGAQSLDKLNHGTYSYYVKAELDGEQYLLPGEIEIDIEETEDSDGDYEAYKYYMIKKLYFPDGKAIEFRNYDNYISSLNDVVGLRDQYGNEWDCQLTDKHAYCEQIEETSFTSKKAIVEFWAFMAIIIGNWLAYLLWDEKEMQKYKNWESNKENTKANRGVALLALIGIGLFIAWLYI